MPRRAAAGSWRWPELRSGLAAVGGLEDFAAAAEFWLGWRCTAGAEAQRIRLICIERHREAGIPHGPKSVNRTMLSYVSDGSQRAAWTNGLMA